MNPAPPFTHPHHTTLDPITGHWHVVITGHTQQDWLITPEVWHCRRFNVTPPNLGAQHGIQET